MAERPRGGGEAAFKRWREGHSYVPVTPESFRSILETEHGYTVEDSVPPSFSSPQFTVFGDIPESSVEMILLKSIERRCVAQLSSPIFFDSFGSDHTARRSFQNEMEKRYGAVANEFFSHNKQKRAFGDSIASELSQLDALFAATSSRTPAMDELSSLVARIPTTKAHTDSERKIRIQEMDEIARTFLRLVKVLSDK